MNDPPTRTRRIVVMPRSAHALSFLLFVLPSLVTDGDEIDFARDIRPMLSDNCYHCHGPDEETREADLRLDTRDGLFQKEGASAIVSPNHPEASELIRRIATDDADE